MSTSQSLPRRSQFVLTNRMNLNGVLSSRIIGPRDSYSKYYRDLLDLTGGPVPVLAQPPSGKLVAYVSEKVKTGPALLELKALSVNDDESTVRLVEALPFGDVIAVHLPDQTSLREHLARRYPNVHPHDDLLKVSPDLFDGSVTMADIQSAVKQPLAATQPTAFDWRRVDRVRGAISAAIAASENPDDLQVAARLLPGSSADWYGEYLNAEHTMDSPDDADAQLLRVVTEILIRTDVRMEWDPTAILEQVRRAITRSPEAAAHREMIELNLARVTAVLSDQRQFTPFRATGTGLRTAKALMLVLLRQDLGALLTWQVTETGADPRTRQLAAIFAGLLRGLSREKCSLRSVSVDDYTAAWACSSSTSAVARPDGSAVEVVERHDEMALLIRGQHVRAVPLADNGPSDLFRSLPDDVRREVAPALVAATGALDVVSIRISSSSAEITTNEKGRLSITLPGDASVEYHYDLEALADRLNDITPEQMHMVVPLLRKLTPVQSS